MMVICDVEGNGLDPDRLWCIVVKEVNGGKTLRFTDWDSFLAYVPTVSCWVGHHFLGYDLPVINKLIKADLIKPEDVIDTLVVSRLENAGRVGGHSVDAWGRRIGIDKVKVGDDQWDDESLLPLYLERCEVDVEIQYRIFMELAPFIFDPANAKALRVEHEIAIICEEMGRNGFAFDYGRASELLSSIQGRIEEVESYLAANVRPIVEHNAPVVLRRKKDGTPYIHSLNALGGTDTGYRDGDILRTHTTRPFNPGSVKDRIDYLWECGWNPTEKTKTHRKAERELGTVKRKLGWRQSKASMMKLEQEKLKLEARLDNFKTYGWTVSDRNLDTLPVGAPDAALKLTEWLCLDGRRGDLVEWMSAYVPGTKRIHGTIHGIGSWTHRASHSNPNSANIVSAFGIGSIRGSSPSPVELVKLSYDSEMRACWGCADGAYLVGTDADGIQLRILAELLGDEGYRKTVVEGKKEDGTDVHSVSRNVLGSVCNTRDDAKTFIYAWLLGAGTGEVSRIFNCNSREAKRATDTFVDRTPGLRELKEERIPYDAGRGYFIGFDGRKVQCSSAHLMLAGYLQNGESVVMKHANVIWKKELLGDGINYKQVNWVHDEWQTEVYTEEEAIRVGQVQADSIRKAGIELGFVTPLSGTYDVGRNWLETH